MRYKILLVDDEKENREIYQELLKAEGFTVLVAANTKDALLAALDSKPDLILSDVAMPNGDGLAFCRNLKADRRSAAIPVILMSGVHKGEEDQVEGIEGGADDYLAKPFSPGLLCAKVRAVLRRYASPEDLAEVLKSEDMELDVQGRRVTCGGRPVSLTRKEFDLLTTFLRKPGRVLSVPYLLETVWSYDPADYNVPHTVSVHVSNLRRKLGPKFAKRVASLPGSGYRFD